MGQCACVVMALGALCTDAWCFATAYCWPHGTPQHVIVGLQEGGRGTGVMEHIFLRIHYAQWLHPRPVVTAQEKPYMLPDREYTSSTVICCSASAGAVMLSGETANGKHPALVVKTMAAIVANAELAVDYQEQYHVIRWVDHSQGLWSFHHAHPLSRTRPLHPRPPPTHPPTYPPPPACLC